MRYLVVIPAVIALGACNVSKDDNGVTVQYDENTAQNAAADVGNTAQDIASDISNDVQATGDKIENRVDRDKDAKTDAPANATENK